MELLRPQQQQNNNNCNTSTNLNNIIGSGANSNANGNGNAHQIQQQNRVAMAIYNADIQSNRSNLNNSGSNNCTSSMSNQTVSTVFSDLQSALCDDIWNKINERVWIRIREVLLNQQQAQPQSQKGPGQEISQEQLRLQFRDLANVGIALSAEYLRLGKNLNQTVMSASTLQKQKSENQFEQTFQTSQQNPGAELESVTNTLISSDSEDKLNIESEVLVVRSRIMELLRAAQRTVSILSSQSLPKKDTCQLLHASSTVCIGCQMSQSQESESQEIIVNQQQTSVKSQSEENQTQDLDGNKLDSDSDSEEKNNIKVNSQTQQQTKSSKTKTPTLDSIQTEALSIAITLLSCLFDKINNHLVVISQSCSREDVTMVANVLLGLISDSVYSDLESGDIESSQKQLRLYAVSLLRTVGYEDSEVIPSILSLTQQTTNLTPQKIANLNQLHSCQHTFDGKDKRLFMRLLQKLKTQTHCQSQAVNHKSEKPKVSSDNLNNQTCNAGSGGAGNTNQYETVTRKSNNSEISDSNFHTNLNLTIPPKTNSTLSHSGLGTNTSSTYGELDDLVTDISQSQTTSMQNNCQSLQNHYEHSNSNCKVEDTSATAVTAKEFAESHNQLLSAQQQVYTLQTQTETVNSAAKE